MKHLLFLLSSLTLITSVNKVFASGINTEIDKLTQTWITTEQSTNQLVSDWQLEKQLINQRIAILKQQNKQLNSIVNETNKVSDDLTLRRQRLLSEQNKVEQSLNAYKQILPQFIHLIQKKVNSVPLHIRLALSDILDKISDDKPLSAQYQMVVDSLKLLQKNDKLLQVKQGMINVANQPLMAEQLYLGNDFAWFSTLDGSHVGIGFNHNSTWQWQNLSALFSETYNIAIAQAIKEAKHLTPGQLIDLPVKIEALQ